MSAPGFSLARIWWIASNTVREAIRQRLFVFLLLLAVALVVGALALGEFNFGASELKFLADFGFGALTFFGSLLAVVVSAQLFFGEIENRTALTLLAKPVRRSEFVVGKFAGVWAVLLCFCVLVGVTIAAVLTVRADAIATTDGDAAVARTHADFFSLALFVGLQWVKFGVVAGATVLIASFGRTTLFTICVSFLALTIAHLQYLAHDAWSRAATPVLRIAAGALAWTFPNFQVFNVGDRIAAGGVLPLDLAGRIAGYGMIYLVVLLGLAVFGFRRREV
jgi:ABC-type transport system involved in multi-copper enzyme maturation permease subunit